jgi:hypothetical protein
MLLLKDEITLEDGLPLLDGGRQVEASFKVDTPKECL